jgi:HAE1 family hydrophobic/amphiphilic exporter-1
MIRLFAAHPTAANILMLAFIGLGLFALPTLQRDTFPLIPPSDVEVRIQYPGASPAEVETGICQAVEDPIRAVDNLAELSCLARDNLAVVTAEMLEGADMGRFHDDVKAAVAGVGTLPDKSEDPVTRIVERVATVASIAVTGPEDPLVLLAYADQLAERLKSDPAISQASVAGFSDREIAIEIEAGALQRYGLTIADVASALSRNSLDMPAGTMEGRQGDTLIRFIGERRTPAELATIPLTGSSVGGEVKLGDVAMIATGFSDASQASYFQGRRAAVVTVSKTETQDALKVMAALQRVMAAAQADAPGNIELAISQDTTSNIRDRLEIITNNGIQGLVLVLVVMWLFFGFRFSFWVAWACRSRSSARYSRCSSSA